VGVTNTGNQQYNGALSTNGTYTTNGGNFAVTGATTLAGNTTVNAGAGTISFRDGRRRVFACSQQHHQRDIRCRRRRHAAREHQYGCPGTVTLNGNVTTTGNQTFLDAVIAGTVTLTSTGGSITAVNPANDFTGR
jgi:hypothetical protein